MIICQRNLIKHWRKMIFREEIAKFTPENQVLRPDYLGVGPTGVESPKDPSKEPSKDPPMDPPKDPSKDPSKDPPKDLPIDPP